MKRLVLALLILALLCLPTPVRADAGGCTAKACWSTGYYWIWTFYGPVPCYWTLVQYADGVTLYQDCHSNYTY